MDGKNSFIRWKYTYAYKSLLPIKGSPTLSIILYGNPQIHLQMIFPLVLSKLNMSGYFSDL